MNTESTNCPKCGSELPSDAPQGLCPRCLAALNFDTETMPTSAIPVASKEPLTPGELAPHFPQLEILECLGRGGMGVVYKARQKSLKRLVALKLLAPERADDASFAARFEKEAHALAAMNHPHIVTIHDFGQAGEFYYLLMEFVDGVNLRQAMSTGRFKPEEALAIVPPVCEALQYAHEHGIVHRDIKPENLLMDKDGRVKIADFGIAKIVARESSGRSEGVDPDGDLRTTTVGTPAYAAPEQQSDPTHVDHRADIYSLGVVLYELLTGELPKGNLEAPSSRVQIDVRLDEIVLRALEAQPDRRYSTAEEFRTQLATLVSSSGDSGGGGPKSDTCYISTPEHLSSFWGSLANIYTGKGHLVLDRGRLTFTVRDGAPIVIPVSSILDLSIGQYPAAAKPVSLDFISVTFDEGGGRRQFLFTPNRGALMPTWETNRIVADWFKAIQEATREVTGRTPPSSPADQLGAPRWASGSSLPVFAVIAGAGLLLYALFSRQFAQPNQSILLVGAILLMTLSPLVAGLLLRSRLEREGQPPVRRPWRWAGVAGMALGIGLLLGSQGVNDMIDDVGLTSAAREHMINRQKVKARLASVRAEVSAMVAKKNEVESALSASTDDEEKNRLRDEVGALTRESERLHQASILTERALSQADKAQQHLKQQRTNLLHVLAAVLLGLGLMAFFHRARDGADASPRRRSPGCIAFGIIAAAGMVAMLAIWSTRMVDHVSGPVGVVKNIESQLVAVDGNAVTVELQIYVENGPVEVRAELDGNPAPGDKGQALVDSDRNTSLRTLVTPGAPVGNHPWRTFQPGMHRWRLRYLLPTVELAKQAAENLQTMAAMPPDTGNTYAGTVFRVKHSEEADYLALLHVSAVMTSADPRWLSVDGSRSWNETSLRATWTVRARQPSKVNLLGNGDHQSAGLELNRETKFHEVPVILQLDRIGKDRVRITKEIGGSTVTSDTTGDYLALRDEILDTALNTTKGRTGVSVELCRLDGDRLMLNTPLVVNTPPEQTFPARVVTVEYSGVDLMVPMVVVLVIVLAIVVLLVRKQRKQKRMGCTAAVIAFVAIAFFSVAAAVLLYFLAARPGGGEPIRMPEVPAVPIEPRSMPESPPLVPKGR